MRRDQVDHVLTAALEGRRLLDHPFYRRWEEGALQREELAAYAEQYRIVERELPSVLRAAVDVMEPCAARDLVAANLADEVSAPEPHAVLFESFADAVGARAGVPPTEATGRLVAMQRRAAAEGPAAAVAVIAAYEVQAAEVAVTKSAGLSRHYGVDARGTRFWDVHGVMETSHASWSVEALALLDPDPAVLGAASRGAAQAWWEFLDEREALAPTPA